MKNFNKLLIFILMIALNTVINAQKSDMENVLKINSDFDKASLNGDLSFFEKTLAPEFISYQPDGSVSTRAEMLERVKKEKENPTFQFLSIKSDDVKVKIDGNLAYVTGQWRTSTKGIDSNSLPHDDTGFYTAAFEKRNGKWMLLSDHSTEKIHTPEELEPSLRQASDDYDKAIRTQDPLLFSELLSEEFTSVNSEGKVSTKAEEVAQINSPDLKITSVKSDDKKFRIHRSTAVETGRFNVTGTFKGKAFSDTGRYTSTWFYSNGKWMLASDHTSIIR